MDADQRRATGKKFIEEVDWDTYDYTKAPGADMKFPDFTEAQCETKPFWCSKHYNDIGDWSTCHVIDLNQIQDGQERRLMALYGVPVEWPDIYGGDPDGLNSLINELDDARSGGGDEWEEAKASHGLLNDEHYTWLRGRSLRIPEALTNYESAVEAIALIDATLKAKRNPGDLYDKYGFRDQEHFDYFKRYVGRAKDRAWGEHDKLLQQTWKALDERFEKNKEALADELSPFKGVSLEDWAGANAQLSQAKPIAHILKVLGIDQPAWDEVNAEWMARMSRDTTATVATVYGQAFTGAGVGKFGAAAKAVSASMKAGHGKDVAGDEPVSFEDWIKIQAHMNAAVAQGIDPNALLKQYELTAADWGAAGGYWAMKMNSNPAKYMSEYSAFSAKYANAFTGAKAGADIDF